MQAVTGIYTNNFDSALNKKNGFPVFATVVEANYVEKKQDLFAAYKLTDEDKADIQKLSKDPRIGQRVQILVYFMLILICCNYTLHAYLTFLVLVLLLNLKNVSSGENVLLIEHGHALTDR